MLALTCHDHYVCQLPTLAVLYYACNPPTPCNDTVIEGGVTTTRAGGECTNMLQSLHRANVPNIQSIFLVHLRLPAALGLAGGTEPALACGVGDSLWNSGFTPG